MFQKQGPDENDEIALKLLCQSLFATEQSRRGFLVLLDQLGTYDVPYDPTSASNTVYLVGRQAVGRELAELAAEINPQGFADMIQEKALRKIEENRNERASDRTDD